MILVGIKLMLVGMTTVALFLCLTIVLIQLVAKLTAGFAARELEELAKEKRRRELMSKTNKERADLEDDIAVIAAAIAAYETERLARS
ncbi:MAG: hypothetical protein CSA21_06085 [Deltaproteobacteria bacterium]|nr:MAG: hypothetical protein CSA21_06085 [Deltaproteobacteria bacterium]